MKDRLEQCLVEVMFSNDCRANLRQTLEQVLELNEKISYMNVNDFEDYFNSEEFTDDIYELFGVDINK